MGLPLYVFCMWFSKLTIFMIIGQKHVLLEQDTTTKKFGWFELEPLLVKIKRNENKKYITNIIVSTNYI